MPKYEFPDGFLWGAATAAYQIEGSVNADGRGESIWDRFAHTPGNIWNNETGDRACDHYRNYREDVAMMADLGLNAYRFSIAWPRIFPQGGGRPNREGLDFYRRLLEALHEHKITPAATLFHWDLPQALQDKGGWANRDTARYFAEYAAYLFEQLDLPVGLWITLNEPRVFAHIGHALGVHAPGISDFNVYLQVAHNLLLGHGLAVQAFREAKREEEQIGITLDLLPLHPASDSEADLDAAQRTDAFMNRWYLDPLFKGEYPAEMQEILSRLFTLPEADEGDLAIISSKCDFLGVNNYTRMVVGGTGAADEFFGAPLNPQGAEYTDMGWEVYPNSLYELLTRVHREYGPIDLYVTENGAAFPDELKADGSVEDDRRINYLDSYLKGAWRALDEGVPLKGYFAWTLMDNFEWAFGYSMRFGLVYVDFETMKRYLKKSAYWYRQVIGKNGLD